MTASTAAPIHFLATPVAALAFGTALPDIASEAFLEIGRMALGYVSQHPQFRTARGLMVAVTSRVKAFGIVEIEIVYGQPSLPSRSFTREDAHRAGRRS